MKQRGCDFFDDDEVQELSRKMHESAEKTPAWDDEDPLAGNPIRKTPPDKEKTSSSVPLFEETRDKTIVWERKKTEPETEHISLKPPVEVAKSAIAQEFPSPESEKKQFSPKATKQSKNETMRFRFYWHTDKNAFSTHPPTTIPMHNASDTGLHAPIHHTEIEPDIIGQDAFSQKHQEIQYLPNISNAPTAPVKDTAQIEPTENTIPINLGTEIKDTNKTAPKMENMPRGYVVNRIADTDIRLLGQLLEIERDAFGEEGMNKWDIVPIIRYGRVFAMMEGKAVLGAAYFIRNWEEPSVAYLVGIAMRSDMRGRDLGTHLLNQAMNLLEKEGLEKVELVVDPENLYAIGVYREKLGFYECGERHAEYGPGEDRLLMNAEL
jgi:[ribosomal protein S18]-alanine N-acetyltransferase